jgi:hypothetical protein
MRMLDDEKNVAVDNLILYLKKSEAIELFDALETLLEAEDYDSHIHVSEDSYQREVTVLLYDENNIHKLNERSKKLILEGK